MSKTGPSLLLAALLLPALTCRTGAQAPIHRCVTADGVPLFTDLPCPAWPSSGAGFPAPVAAKGDAGTSVTLAADTARAVALRVVRRDGCLWLHFQ